MTENTKKLIAALRSGEYEQGKGRLRTKRGYCCLGVACDLYRQETGNGRWEEVGRFVGDYVFVQSRETGGEWREEFYLPGSVRDWLGFTDWRGCWDPYDDGKTLAVLNDGGDSFDRIADAIEEHETLFGSKRTDDTTEG